jgi:hypothetical protein
VSDFLARLDQRPKWLRATRWLLTAVLSVVAIAIVLAAVGRAFEAPSLPTVPEASGVHAQTRVLQAHRAVLTWVAWRGTLPASRDDLEAAGLLPGAEGDRPNEQVTIQSTVERYRIDPPRNQ